MSASPAASFAAAASATSCLGSLPSGPQPSFTAVKPSSQSFATRSAVSSGVSGISIDAYARTRSCFAPPSSSWTGLPSALPLMSHNAMSMPDSAWRAIPRRPM